MIRLFVGLGNPGPEDEDTRHNAGFWYIDGLARRLGVFLQPDRAYHGLVARANTPQGPVWLLQPQTYMNLSGKSVAALARFFKVNPDEVLVAQAEREAIFKCIDQSLDATEAFLQGDMNQATKVVHAGPQRPKPPRKEPSSPAPGDAGDD